MTARMLRTLALTAITMAFFAANSVLARLALRGGEIDAGTYTAVRIGSGAAALVLLMALHGEGIALVRANGSWGSAATLAGFATAYSFAYLSLDAGVGALIQFAMVQITMNGAGLYRGERPRVSEWAGLALALGGLAYLVSPGLTAPPLGGALLMALAGVGWGWYSLAATGVERPAAANAGNFVRAAPAAAVLALLVWSTESLHASAFGVELAMLSGAVTTGLGCAIWYRVARSLSASRAAIVQLSVPVLAATAGVVFLGEQPTWRLALAGAAILGGVALASLGRDRGAEKPVERA
jgi:drug/metabolite transporter (DMT)-like permease